jgi:hypothetical protein
VAMDYGLEFPGARGGQRVHAGSGSLRNPRWPMNSDDVAVRRLAGLPSAETICARIPSVMRGSELDGRSTQRTGVRTR